MERPFESLNQIKLTGVDHILDTFHSQNGDAGRLSFFKMAAPAPYHGLLALIRSNGATISLGLSLQVDEVSAARSAFYEAMGNFATFRDDPTKFEQERGSSADTWNCNLDFLVGLESLLVPEHGDARPFMMPSLRQVHLDISKLDALRGCPITPVKFVGEEAQ